MILAQGIQNDFTAAFEDLLRRSKESSRKSNLIEFSDASSQSLTPAFSLQRTLRPLFGKSGINTMSIGGHPDYDYLKGSGTTKSGYITTLFMDMENSSRLALVTPLEDVYFIKNAFIQLAMEVIKTFDGHVHRVMGDAVMAFFGGPTRTPEQASVDAINAAAVINAFSQNIVIPHLEKKGLGDSFGIRIGLDYGSQDAVLWSSYGYYQMEEVTATSFYVDSASKLQHSAGRNEIMIGQSLRDFLDFPQELLHWKQTQRGGQMVDKCYLTPNYRINGKELNYEMQVLNWEKYLSLTNLVDHQILLDSAESITPFAVTVDIRDTVLGYAIPYHPCASHVRKNVMLDFKVTFTASSSEPCRIEYIVQNHGREAMDAQHMTHRNGEELQGYTGGMQLSNEESTQYRGLHSLTIRLTRGGKVIGRRKIGVYIL
jgi:class 3 adenylate cyclase